MRTSGVLAAEKHQQRTIRDWRISSLSATPESSQLLHNYLDCVSGGQGEGGRGEAPRPGVWCAHGAPHGDKARLGWGSALSEGVVEREFCLLKGIAEGTYNTKHAEAARLYYTTTYTHTHTPTEL